MKILTYISLFFLGVHLYGQNVQSNQSIQSNFSEKNIVAYQNSSVGMIEEFYEYLSLYSKETNEELQKQIKENILNLVESKEIQLINITENSIGNFSLDDLLQQIKGKNILFQTKNIEASKNLGSNYWMNTYQLFIVENGKTTEKTIKQRVQFQPMEKKFGSTTKYVWSVKLGSVQ